MDLIGHSRKGTDQHLSLSRWYNKYRKLRITMLNKDSVLHVEIFSKKSWSIIPNVIHHCYLLFGKQDMDKERRSTGLLWEIWSTCNPRHVSSEHIEQILTTCPDKTVRNVTNS